MRTVWCRTSILIDQYGCTIYLQLFDFGYGAAAELCTRGHKIPELQADVESKEPAEEMRVPFMMKRQMRNAIILTSGGFEYALCNCSGCGV